MDRPGTPVNTNTGVHVYRPSFPREEETETRVRLVQDLVEPRERVFTLGRSHFFTFCLGCFGVRNIVRRPRVYHPVLDNRPPLQLNHPTPVVIFQLTYSLPFRLLPELTAPRRRLLSGPRGRQGLDPCPPSVLVWSRTRLGARLPPRSLPTGRLGPDFVPVSCTTPTRRYSDTEYRTRVYSGR